MNPKLTATISLLLLGVSQSWAISLFNAGSFIELDVQKNPDLVFSGGRGTSTQYGVAPNAGFGSYANPFVSAGLDDFGSETWSAYAVTNGNGYLHGPDNPSLVFAFADSAASESLTIRNLSSVTVPYHMKVIYHYWGSLSAGLEQDAAWFETSLAASLNGASLVSGSRTGEVVFGDPVLDFSESGILDFDFELGGHQAVTFEASAATHTYAEAFHSVPEPSTNALVAGGIAALALARKRTA